MEKIKQFLQIIDGYGSGSGDGSGSGYGYGSGSGDGSGSGISEFNGIKIYIIDSIETGITELLRENIAKGFILNRDLTTSACYIVKENNQFAHGTTVKEAFLALKEKLFDNYTIEERIQKFKEEFKDFSRKYSGSLLFDWHNKLTGSCKLGRESFCRNNNISLEDTFTIYEFIELTKDQYGGDIIKQLI
jgi:hypothetical protein